MNKKWKIAAVGCRTLLLFFVVFFSACKAPPPGISGSPATTAPIGSLYSFTPKVASLQAPVTFVITNKPVWATFDAATGRLSGTPSASSVGNYAGIVISATAIPVGGTATSTYSLAAFAIEVPPPVDNQALRISASALAGSPPFKVRFNINTGALPLIDRFRWDVGLDGVYESDYGVDSSFEYMFVASGLHKVRLSGVTPSGSVIESNTLEINVSGDVEPEDVDLDIVASHYYAPVGELVTFMVKDGLYLRPKKIEWDFNGDGVVDKTQTNFMSGNNFLALYPVIDLVAGTYIPKAKVYLDTTTGTPFSASMKNASLVIYKKSDFFVEIQDAEGFSTLKNTSTEEFYPVFSAVYKGVTAAQVQTTQWDLDMDGVVDGIGASFSPNLTDCRSHSLQIRAVTQTGIIAENRTDIIYAGSFDVAFQPGNAGVVDVARNLVANFSVTARCPFPFSVYMESDSGEKVAVLKALGAPAGQLPVKNDFSWNGRNQTSVAVAEGGYQIIVEYQQDGITKRYSRNLIASDLLPGAFDWKNISITPTAYNAKFDVFNNDPLEMTFTLDSSSKVTAFMGLRSIGMKVQNLINGQYLAAGEHKLYWYASDEDGSFLELASDAYPQVGIWASLSDFPQVLVLNRPVIGKTTVSPTVFSPMSGAYSGSRGKSHIRFDLDRASKVILTVNSADSGKFVYQKTYPSVSKGAVDLEWDGKDSNGIYVGNGRYRYKVVASSSGSESTPQFGMQQIWH